MFTDSKKAKLDANTKEYWNIEECGDYGKDCERGREAAYVFMDKVSSDTPFLLGYVVEAMIQKGRFGSIEIGFCHAVASKIAASNFSLQQNPGG